MDSLLLYDYSIMSLYLPVFVEIGLISKAAKTVVGSNLHGKEVCAFH
jgi:hypothetical protein